MIETEDYQGSRGMLDLFKQQYGKGEQKNQYIEEYTWFADKVFLTFKENSITKKAKIMMLSVPLYEMRKKDNAQKVKNASKDL